MYKMINYETILKPCLKFCLISIIGLTSLLMLHKVRKTGSENDPIRDRETRIIDPYKFPDDQVLGTVLIEIIVNSIKVTQCSGTILSSKVILSAASCFLEQGKDLNFEQIDIYIGIREQNLNSLYQTKVNPETRKMYRQFRKLKPHEQKISLLKKDMPNQNWNTVIKKDSRSSSKIISPKMRRQSYRYCNIALLILPGNFEINFEKTNTAAKPIFAPNWNNSTLDFRKVLKKNMQNIRPMGGLYTSREAAKEWKLFNIEAEVVGYGVTNIKYLYDDEFSNIIEAASHNDHDNDADDDNYIPIPNIENIKNTKIHEQGLGFAKYLIPHQRECRDKWMDITNTRQPFFNLKNIFCGFTIQNSIEEKSSIKPVCGSDNGGSLLINIKLHELKDKVNLYENTVQALRGMTIWSDVDCENDINGFLDVQVYLSWMKEVLGEELFGEINRQIVPSQHNVEVFETYKGVIFDWRRGLDEK